MKQFNTWLVTIVITIILIVSMVAIGINALAVAGS